MCRDVPHDEIEPIIPEKRAPNVTVVHNLGLKIGSEFWLRRTTNLLHIAISIFWWNCHISSLLSPYFIR